jgi:hypothetical protein
MGQRERKECEFCNMRPFSAILFPSLGLSANLHRIVRETALRDPQVQQIPADMKEVLYMETCKSGLQESRP